jgi:uncharacterized protein related to proFAR isomerase
MLMNGKARLSSTPIADHIRMLAAKHKIVHVQSSLDEWADTVTRLSGDDVQLDDVELLLVELSKVGVITGNERTVLQVKYLHERNAGV